MPDEPGAEDAKTLLDQLTLTEVLCDYMGYYLQMDAHLGVVVEWPHLFCNVLLSVPHFKDRPVSRGDIQLRLVRQAERDGFSRIELRAASS